MLKLAEWRRNINVLCQKEAICERVLDTHDVFLKVCFCVASCFERSAGGASFERATHATPSNRASSFRGLQHHAELAHVGAHHCGGLSLLIQQVGMKISREGAVLILALDGASLSGSVTPTQRMD